MAVKIQFIKSPSVGTMGILARRRTGSGAKASPTPGAVGLVQGALADMIMAADVAEKAAQVEVEEIRGICPQHVTLIGIFGEIADVDTALKAVREFFALQDEERRFGSGEEGGRK